MNSRKILLFTLFDTSYFVKGIAMMQSAEKHSSYEIRWTVLAMDEVTKQLLLQLNKKNLKVVTPVDIGPDFIDLKNSRTHKEFCWSGAAFLFDHLVKREPESSLMAYIDADCYFFDDIGKCFDELGNFFAIGIHKHNFSNKNLYLESIVGKFNVGVVIGRNSKDLSQCIGRWKEQVSFECTDKPSEGFYGDQKYLDEWPLLYNRLKIFENTGIGIAPWNLDNKLIDFSYQALKFKNNLVVYHFHGISIMKKTKSTLHIRGAKGYKIPFKIKKYLYEPYIKHILNIEENYFKELSRENYYTMGEKEFIKSLFPFVFKFKTYRYFIY